MEGRGSGARKREATSPGEALERPLGLRATPQEALEQGTWRILGQEARAGHVRWAVGGEEATLNTYRALQCTRY